MQKTNRAKEKDRTSDPNLIDRLRKFVVSEFPAATNELAITDSLLESGLVDSLGILEIVHFIESELKVTLQDEDMVAENFETVERIALFVQSQLANH